LRSCGVAVGIGEPDAVVVDDEHALIAASESRDMDPPRTRRYRVRKQVPKDEAESVRGNRELAGRAGDDLGATISEVGNRLLNTFRQVRYAGGGLIRAHRRQDRVDEIERARQALARILVAKGGQEGGFHVVRDKGSKVVECFCLSSKSGDVFNKLFLCRRSCCCRLHLH